MTGEELKSIRRALGKSQHEFADLLKVGMSTVSKWETGITTVPDSIAELVYSKLNTVKLLLSPEELAALHKRLKEINKTIEEYVAGLIKATL